MSENQGILATSPLPWSDIPYHDFAARANMQRIQGQNLLLAISCEAMLLHDSWGT